ncbi:hypothetical protein ASL14_00185 [Paenibacillus sp. IHB B 3084]|uniref:transposase n=1 Tax=Paenibacillus sp. IHB B 3084 TaxID=867076 RepID=UPI00071F1CBB|nr:hypothetical protein ASL14_00185 [Paenibacillus sp. IHB B 3084]
MYLSIRTLNGKPLITWRLATLLILRTVWGGHLWNSSFFIETIGSISEQAIKKYIENQKKGDG